MLRKLIVMMVGLALLGGFAVATADGKKGELTLRVDTFGFMDFSTSPSVLPGPPGAAFYVSGDICEELVLDVDNVLACTRIGKFHCWGWTVNAAGEDPAVFVVSQEFDLFDRGKIQLQGVEDGGPRAVVGGTGDFRNVRGEATGFDFTPAGDEFLVSFKLIGAKRNKKGDDDD